MNLILQQLGDLFVSSVPTVILFLLVLISYKGLVYGPLTRLLAERRERTLGAVEKASAAIRSADAKSQEYDAKLRAARVELGRQREQRMKQFAVEREAILQDTRHAAQERVKQAVASMDHQAVAARVTIEADADQLAEKILAAILPSAAQKSTSIEGAR